MPENRLRVAGLAAVAALILLAGCGGDDSTSTTQSSTAAAPATQAAATEAPAVDAETTMRDYFTAINAGDTERICALENDTLEQFKYDATGQACFDDLSNQQAQPAIPAGDDVTIVDTQEGDASTSYVVTDPKGATINITLVREGDGWVLEQFT